MRSPNCSGATFVCRRSFLLSMLAGATSLLLVAPARGRADTTAPPFRTFPLVTSGDQWGSIQIPSRASLYLAGLSDAGEIVFTAGDAQATQPEMLLKWADGLLYSIAAPSTGMAGSAPGPVYWTHDLTIDRPVSVNRRGYVLFSADHTNGPQPWGTFLWNPSNQQITSIALKGMPATGDYQFVAPGGSAPALNNANEIALIGRVTSPAQGGGYGLFFLGQDGVLRSVLLPGGALPDGSGSTVANTDPYFMPSINDAGVIAFLTRARASSQYGAYLWEYGTIIPVMTSGSAIPGQGRVIGVSSVSVNNQNRGVLVTATTDRWGGGRQGLYRSLNGRITTVAAPDWTMPGGGTLQTIQYVAKEAEGVPNVGVSGPNAAGEYAFVGTLTDGSSAVYQITAGGTLSLVSRIGGSLTAPPVQITDVLPSLKPVPGSRPCLNNHGQIALSVQVPGGRCTILLMTPVKP